MVGAAFIAIVALITGGSETYLYIEAQQDPATRIGVCGPKVTYQCVTIMDVYVAAWNGDQVTLRPVGGGDDYTITRIGGADPSAFPKQDKVEVECYLGDEVVLRDRTTGAFMKLANYPEPPLRFWVPELSVGLFCLAVWISLFLWRRHLFASLVDRSTQ